MALFIPDISHHQKGINIGALKQEGAAALIARVGQGKGVTRAGTQYGLTQDREWGRHRDEARRVGLPLVAYWYVGNRQSADDQAAKAAAWSGDTDVPWMIDHEDASGSIAFYHEILAAWAERGLKVVLGYIPKWYYDAVGGGQLTPGPPIVNSRYSTRRGAPAQIYGSAGADTGAGWVDFGGQTTALWQFTNQASMAGMAIDCSAFRGNQDQLMRLLAATPQPVPQPLQAIEEDDEMKTFYARGDATGKMPTPHDNLTWGAAVFHVEATANGLVRRHIAPEEWALAEGAGNKVTQVRQAWLDKIPGADGKPVVLFPWENAGGGPVPGQPS